MQVREDTRRPAMLRDAADMWHEAHRTGLAPALKALHRRRPGIFVIAAIVDWTLVALATVATVTFGWVAVPVALLVIGNRQRALGNLLHDVSHWSMDDDRRRAAAIANLLFCWPLWIAMPLYRSDHESHHRFLADPARDPDFIHDESRLPLGWRTVWLDQLRSRSMFRNALLGHIGRMDGASLAWVCVWWSGVLTLVTLATSAASALVFLALWMVARATVFHAITAFREISDHVGLDPSSMMGFTRNHTMGGLLGQLFHPHHNGYHLVHHLLPGVPFHALPRAHRLLLHWPKYRSAEHCSSYFTGEASAVQSWVRRFATAARHAAAT